MYLSKKLKKRIREIAGLDRLSKDERVGRAYALVDDIDFKQRLCNRVPGLDYKTIERCLKSIISSERPKATDEEILRSTNPEKFEGLGVVIPLCVKRLPKLTTYTLEETLALINAPEVSSENKPKFDRSKYSTYSLEEVQILLKDEHSPNIKSTKSKKYQ